MTLVRSTAPAETPISLAEAKAHLRVDSADEDTYIGGLIDAAVAFVDAEGVLGRAMVSQEWSLWVSNSPGAITVTLGPFVSLDGVSYYDTDNVLQAATLADFESNLCGDFVTVKPKSGNSWPSAYSRPDAIRIDFTAGFGAASAVPAGIKHALLMLVAHWYQNREAVSELSLRDTPMAFDALIGVERVGWYG